MVLKTDKKFKGKLTCASKNGMRNLAIFHQGTWKSQNWDFVGILSFKVDNIQLKSYSGVMCHENEE